MQIDGLVFAPWISGPQRRDHKIVRDFRADAITLAAASAKLHPRGLSRSRPGQNHPLPRDQTKENPMTSIHTYDPAVPQARPLPELPPLPSARWRSALRTCSRTRPTCRSPGTRPVRSPKQTISIQFAPVNGPA